MGEPTERLIRQGGPRQPRRRRRRGLRHRVFAIPRPRARPYYGGDTRPRPRGQQHKPVVGRLVPRPHRKLQLQRVGARRERGELDDVGPVIVVTRRACHPLRPAKSHHEGVAAACEAVPEPVLRLHLQGHVRTGIRFEERHAAARGHHTRRVGDHERGVSEHHLDRRRRTVRRCGDDRQGERAPLDTHTPQKHVEALLPGHAGIVRDVVGAAPHVTHGARHGPRRHHPRRPPRRVAVPVENVVRGLGRGDGGRVPRSNGRCIDGLKNDRDCVSRDVLVVAVEVLGLHDEARVHARDRGEEGLPIRPRVVKKSQFSETFTLTID